MRLPWVSRATLERVEHELATWFAVREQMIADIAEANARALDAEKRAAYAEGERALWERLRGEQRATNAAVTTMLQESQEAYKALTMQVVDLKRAEAGLPPAAFDASLLDPMNSLGPKTQLAVDEFAAGDPEMKKYLVGRAHLEYAAMRGQSDDMEKIDRELAAKIRRGDQ